MNFVCTYRSLLQVVSYYDFSVLSMTVVGFQNSDRGVGGWVGWTLSSFFWGIFLLCKAPNLMNLLTLARRWEKRSWHRGCHSSAQSEPVSSSRQSGRRADQHHANLASGSLEHRKNGGWRTNVDLGKKEAGWRTSVSLGRRAGNVGRNEHLLPEATPWSIDT